MPATLSADDLFLLNIPNKLTELVRGRLVVREPLGGQHGYVALRVAVKIARYFEEHDLGVAFAAETGFKLFSDPDTVRAPDVAFVAKARVPDPIPARYPGLAPDLAVEVLSPSDRHGEVLAKVADWLEAGSALVWVIDPIRQIARVYRADGSESLLALNSELDGENVLPGFTCTLKSIL